MVARRISDVVWPRLGLTIVFTTYGGGDLCDDGLAQQARIRGARIWIGQAGGLTGSSPAERW